jgi:hypothetical protein
VVSSGLEDFENGGLPPGDAAPSLLGWLDVSDVVRAFLGHLHEKKLVLPKSMLQVGLTEVGVQGWGWGLGLTPLTLGFRA